MDIAKIKEDGFISKNHRGEKADFAYLSLEIAIRAYSSTYKSFLENEGFDKLIDPKLSDDLKDSIYPHEYIVNCTETIIHLQHFFELIVKDSLRSEHELLATDTQDEPVLLYKLLKNQPLENDLDQNKKTVEFQKALNRLISLIDNQLIDEQYYFLKDYKDFLRELNILRNRLLHRGVFVLRYEALDWLMIKFAIPLINELLKRKTFVFKMTSYKWKPKPLFCGLKPFDELINCISGEHYDIKKVSLIKEMIRSSYNNPLGVELDGNKLDHVSTPRDLTSDNESIIKRSKQDAELTLSQSTEWFYGNMIHRITKCPVCGVDSLLIYEDYYDINSNPPMKFNNKVKCCCCSFEIGNHIDIFETAGIAVENFWLRNK